MMSASAYDAIGLNVLESLPWANAGRVTRTPERLGREVSLAGDRYRLCSFETRRPGESLAVAPRTVGWTAVLAEDKEVAAREAEAVRVCEESTAAPPSPESAREKVVFCDRRGRTFVYQADRDNRAASLCACGNAAGAMAAMLAVQLERGCLEQTLVLPDGEIGMHAEVRRQDGRLRVRQRWTGVELTATPTRLGSHEVAICKGTLNDYLLVRLPDAGTTFGLAEAKALWGEARQAFGFEDILRCRLAAIAPEGTVRFFTCGRMHPGAPLTGLAALALAAETTDWLAPLRQSRVVRHRRGEDRLPDVLHGDNGAVVELPTVDVVLRNA